MGKGWRTLRRRMLTPHVSATSLEVRGFHKKDPDSCELLETVGKEFLSGYGDAVEVNSTAELKKRLEEVPEQFRGFAYEGAAMGYTVLDGLPVGGRRHLAEFLAGVGERHVYTAYVGIGWAMARLPRFRWPRVDTFDPLLRWLVLDGYGFHQAYFHTRRYVYEQFRNDKLFWPARGTGSYQNRAVDQGIGRAMWFVGGTDAERVATMIEKFPVSRRSDLYGGAGLAAAYAGGASEEELRRFRERAGEHRAQVAQGAAFAAEARLHGGVMVPDTELAVEVLCGTTTERAASLTREVRPGRSDVGDSPAYEIWRRRIADEFVSLGRY
ncbi:Protein of unknown function [Actinopolyspora lacussalsi subsp. righensis]|uniref:Enediyne biosynthesis protein n=1 Tax=Actinopolyspora righensis TaxID=995060 RepID=A0A1I6XCG5_9ACTN|nr:DUF1702 family protein [Actinopolyspora righensis]SFT36009.1 Protein of unknown function [Actinopolyspora righensis]